MSTASPLNRATELRERARADPDAVEPRAVLELLRHPDPDVNREAVAALLSLLRVDPAVGTDGVARLAHLLHEEDAPPEFRERVLRCLARIAAERPAAVAPVQADVRSVVDAAGSPLNPAATVCLAQVADVAPDAVGQDVDTFASLLVDGDRPVRRNAAHVLSSLSAERPDAVADVTPALVAALDSEDDDVVTKATAALGHVAAARPAACRDAVDAVATRLEHENDAVRGNATGVLADVASTATGEVGPHVPDLTARLEDGVVVRRNATVALMRLASEGATLGAAATGGLIELLDDPDAAVRRSACRALGHVGDPLALELLRATAEDDDDERVRDAAEWAVDRL